jgi:Flp pilus assembly protein TadG
MKLSDSDKVTKQRARRTLSDARGSQIVELAVTLPLLVVFAVGIFDFGNAFGVKLKVANAAREGARIASVQPSSDLSNPNSSGCVAPQSICNVRDAVSHYLTAAKLKDCGLSTANSPSNTGLSWTFTSSGTCGGTLTLIINRGATYTASLGTPYSSTLTVEATSVQLQYPYNWQFNSVVVLLVPGASYSSSSLLTSTAVMQNLN